MKLKFDHTHYLPVLRWKGGERVALMKLTDSVRRQITPLIEPATTENNLPSKISDDVRRHWGPSPFFLDDLNWPESGNGKTIVGMTEAMRSHGLLAIPV